MHTFPNASFHFRKITNPHADLQPQNPMHPCIPEENRLEFVELLDSLASSGKHAENIESDLEKTVSDALDNSPS